MTILLPLKISNNLFPLIFSLKHKTQKKQHALQPHRRKRIQKLTKKFISKKLEKTKQSVIGRRNSGEFGIGKSFTTVEKSQLIQDNESMVDLQKSHPIHLLMDKAKSQNRVFRNLISLKNSILKVKIIKTFAYDRLSITIILFCYLRTRKLPN